MKTDGSTILNVPNKTQFEADIIDVFENFLNNRGMVCENFDKVAAISESDVDSVSNIYGDDYTELQVELDKIIDQHEKLSIKMTTDRAQIIINNLLSEITSKIPMSQETYMSWLKTEIGITQDEINEMTEKSYLPEAAGEPEYDMNC